MAYCWTTMCLPNISSFFCNCFRCELPLIFTAFSDEFCMFPYCDQSRFLTIFTCSRMNSDISEKFTTFFLVGLSLMIWSQLITDKNQVQRFSVISLLRSMFVKQLSACKGVHKGGWGYPPPSLMFTKTLLPTQRRLIVFAYFLLVNLSTCMQIHYNFKEHCKWAKK